MLDPERVEVAPQATPVDSVEQCCYEVPNIMTKINLLKLLLADKEVFRKVMVFTETKKNADRIVDKLADFWKDELSVIHSNKAQNTRLNALKAFKEGKTRIMVASDVAARGIDVQDVSHVINFDIPSLPEEYVHRIGRTARAGKEGTAISFVSEKEEENFRAIEHLIQQEVEITRLPENWKFLTSCWMKKKCKPTTSFIRKAVRRGEGLFMPNLPGIAKKRAGVDLLLRIEGRL